MSDLVHDFLVSCRQGFSSGLTETKSNLTLCCAAFTVLFYFFSLPCCFHCTVCCVLAAILFAVMFEADVNN